MSRPAEASVRDRYARGAETLEPQLCCPLDYDPRYLAAIPRRYSSGTTAAATRPGIWGRKRPYSTTTPRRFPPMAVAAGIAAAE